MKRFSTVAGGLASLMLLGGGCSSNGGTDPAASGVAPVGFADIAVSAGGHTSCMYLAESVAQRSLGLMEATSLGGRDGMVFRFGETTQSAFYMYKTKMALSIAFIDTVGTVNEVLDMEPCTSAEPRECFLYRPKAPYVSAIEVKVGEATTLGLTPGSKVALEGPCTVS